MNGVDLDMTLTFVLHAVAAKTDKLRNETDWTPQGEYAVEYHNPFSPAHWKIHEDKIN